MPAKRREPLPPTQIEARWGPRHETAEQVRDRLVAMLRGLAKLHPMFRTWHDLRKVCAGSRLGPVVDPRKPAAVLDLVHRGLMKGNVRPYKPMYCGGYWLSLHNGRLPELARADGSDAVKLSVSAGSTAYHVPNEVRLELTPNSLCFEDADLVAQIMVTLAACWGPVLCVDVTAGCYELNLPGVKDEYIVWDRFSPHLGWMVYLPGRRYEPAAVPTAEEVRHVGKHDTLVIVQREPVDMSKKSHAARVERAAAELTLFSPWRIEWPRPRGSAAT